MRTPITRASKKKFEGRMWVCPKCGSFGALPQNGTSDSLWLWVNDSKKYSAGGSHRCRKCCNSYARFRINRNPLAWAKRRLAVATDGARKFGYHPPTITPETLVQLIEESKTCYFCSQPLDWESNEKSRRPHLHHDHVTGNVLGFSHPHCNVIEGWISRMSVAARTSLLKYFSTMDNSLKQEMITT